MRHILEIFISEDRLPRLPKVVYELMQLLDSDDVEINSLAQKITDDPVMHAKVLKLANSAYYASRRSIETVEDAISLMGINSLFTLVITSAVTGAFVKIPTMNLKQFWRHSMVTAGIARQLAKATRQPVELAYIAGLMHNVGYLLIHLAYPHEGATIELTFPEMSIFERRAMEHAGLGVDHCQLGAELAQWWGFPHEIQNLIQFYADPLHPSASKLSPLVYIAIQTAAGLVTNQQTETILEALPIELIAHIDIPSFDWEANIAAYRAIVDEVDSFF